MSVLLLEQQIAQLQDTIASLEARRAQLGDAAVDTSVAALREKLDALRRESAPMQRKLVTVLFSDLVGFTPLAETMDPEDVHELLGRYFAPWREAIGQFGGRLEKYIGDAVMAVFGVPVATETDAEKAIRAALAVRDGLPQLNADLERRFGVHLAMRVGIHTGPVLVAEARDAGDLAITGDTVNLASRLEGQTPPGGILISHDSYRHVRGVFDVEAQPPLMVKGKAEPGQTYLVQRTKPRAFRKPLRGVEGIETRLVGRDAELKHLQEAFHTVIEDGELQVVTVSGDAGVGKSRLLYELDIWSELLPQPFYYFKGRASHEMHNLPYGLIRGLVSFRLQILDSDPADVVRDKLERGVAKALSAGEQAQKCAHIIGHLLGFELGKSRHLAGALDNAQLFRDQALAALVAYLRGLAGRAPVLILLEDLHWADDSSLDAFNHLTQLLAKEPLMVVGTARPALFERRPHWGEGQSFHSRLALTPLSRHDSRRLVAEILQKVDQVPAALRDLLVSEAEGNPFFIEELIRMLIEDGVIVTGEGRWQVEPARLTEIRVPPTLTGVLQARLDRLPPEERTVLQQASVVGRLFWDRAVARIQALPGEGSEADKVADHLAALRGLEMIYQRETSTFAGAQEYIFQHALLREITYEGVLKRLRRVYHGLVADWLLEQAGERAGEYTGLIGDHLAMAGRSEEAVKYLLKAGDQARGLYAHKEAVRAYERALVLLREMGDDERAARTLMKLGLTYHTAFDFRRARQAHEEGFALWQRAGSARSASPLPPAPHALRLCCNDLLTLDPGLADYQASTLVIDQLFSGLVGYTPELSIVPDVAASWEVLDGGYRYLFHLREDVVWSDGAPVTAHDFEYAWRRVLHPATGSRLAGLLYDLKGARAFHEGRSSDLGVRAPDAGSLAVDLEAPTGYFLHLLAFSATYPVPCHVVEARRSSWVGPAGLVTNGPFTLASWQPGDSLVLRRNPRYHGPATGNLLQVQLTLFHDRESSALLEAYEAGLSDVLDLSEVGRELMDRARKLHAAEYVSPPCATTRFLVFEATRPPFDDPRVRRAFALALDRERLVDVLWGIDLPATGSFVPPGMPGHAPGIALPYDPEQARELLAQAGYPGGQGFPAAEMLAFHEPENWDPLVEQWNTNLGVEVRWYSLPWIEHQDRVRSAPPPLYFMGWVGDYPDPDSFLRVAVQRFSAWHHKPYIEAIELARRSLDQEERMELYAQAQRFLAEEVPLLPFSYPRAHLLIKPWVKRYPVSALSSTFWKDVILEAH